MSSTAVTWFRRSCRAVLEAMAVGKAVVATRVGALQDIVLDGELASSLHPTL